MIDMLKGLEGYVEDKFSTILLLGCPTTISWSIRGCGCGVKIIKKLS